MASVDALVEALQQFEGTLIFISHDVYFIRALATHVVHVRSGQLSHYSGGYDYYLEKTRQAARDGLTATLGPDGRGTARGSSSGPGAGSGPGSSSGSGWGSGPGPGPKSTPAPAPAADAQSRKEQKRLDAETRQARARQRRELQQNVNALEKEIGQLEAREKELVAELEDAETYNTPGRPVAINREVLHIQERLPVLHADWERAAERLQALDKGGEA